jgi:hypothetical protein
MNKRENIKLKIKNLITIIGIMGSYNISRIGFHKLLLNFNTKYANLSIESQRKISSYFSSIINATYITIFSIKKIFEKKENLDRYFFKTK